MKYTALVQIVTTIKLSVKSIQNGCHTVQSLKIISNIYHLFHFRWSHDSGDTITTSQLLLQLLSEFGVSLLERSRMIFKEINFQDFSGTGNDRNVWESPSKK